MAGCDEQLERYLQGKRRSNGFLRCEHKLVGCEPQALTDTRTDFVAYQKNWRKTPITLPLVRTFFHLNFNAVFSRPNFRCGNVDTNKALVMLRWRPSSWRPQKKGSRRLAAWCGLFPQAWTST